MKYYFAPMEGITTHVFRAVHSRRFPGADRYYTPFFSPTSDHLFTPRELRELTPEMRCAAGQSASRSTAQSAPERKRLMFIRCLL